MKGKRQNYEVPDWTEEQAKRWMKRHPQVHEEREPLTPEEEKYWEEVRARVRQMREKGEM